MFSSDVVNERCTKLDKIIGANVCAQHYLILTTQSNLLKFSLASSNRMVHRNKSVTYVTVRKMSKEISIPVTRCMKILSKENFETA